VSQGADHGVVPGNGGRYGVGVEHVAGHLPQARLQAQPPGVRTKTVTWCPAGPPGASVLATSSSAGRHGR
jgi:hypothetical protein